MLVTKSEITFLHIYIFASPQPIDTPTTMLFHREENKKYKRLLRQVFLVLFKKNYFAFMMETLFRPVVLKLWVRTVRADLLGLRDLFPCL